MFSVARAAPKAVFSAPTRGMAVSAKALKLRIRSVSSIQRITKTMKMVAASKLKGFQSRMEAARPLNGAVDKISEQLPAREENSSKKVQFVPITSDRGLCGGVNSSVAKFVRNTVQSNPNMPFSIFVIGDKGRATLGRLFPSAVSTQVTDTGKKPPTFLSASLIAEMIAESDADETVFVYNMFKSAIAYDTTSAAQPNREYFLNAVHDVGAVYELEGDESTIMSDLFEFSTASRLFYGMLEQATCEQSARMSAMEGASKNCGEMIAKLTTQMNRARQASITTELCEIVAGAEAIKDAK